jgi:tetratricopeptide (TPR) repeat protein
MSMRIQGIFAAFSLASLASSAQAEPDVAPAEPPALSGDTASVNAAVVEARDAFRLGSALAKQGQWSEALAAFQRSAELRPHPVTTYDIGYCQRALGRPASAYESFRAALEWAAADAPHDASALPPDIAAQARAFLSEAEGRIVRVSVSLPAAGLALRVDGAPVGPLRGDARQAVFLVRGQAETAVTLPSVLELWLDPGPHVFVLTHASGARAVENRSFAAGGHDVLRFEAPESAVRPAASTRVLQPKETAAAPDRTAAWISFGVAAAGLGTSAVFAALALGDRHTLTSDPRCSGRTCPDEPAYRDLESRMTRDADIATVGIAVAGVSAALGTYWWVTARPASDGARVGARAFVGPGAVGVTGQF